MRQRRRTTSVSLTVTLAVALAVPIAAAPVGAAASATASSAGPAVAPAAGSPIEGGWAGHRLIPNADFEQDRDPDTPSYAPPGWTSAHDGSFVSIDRGNAHSGRQSLQVRNVHKDRAESAESTPIAVLPGERITVSAWAKQLSGVPGNLTLQFWRNDGSAIDAGYGRSVTQVPSAGGWQQIDALRDTPDDAVRMTVVLGAPQVGSTAWDDLTIASRPPSAYQVPDGNFEDTRDDQVHTHWTYAGDVSKENTDRWANDRALEITGTSESSSSATSFRIPVVAGDTLTATLWARSVSGTPGTVGLRYVTIDRTAVSGTPAYYRTTEVPGGSTVSAGADTAWHQLTVISPVPAGTTHLEFVLASAGAGTTRWDDLRLHGTSDSGVTGYSDALGTGSVLFVGDQKVESYTGLSRMVHPGTRTGDPALSEIGDGVVLGHQETTNSRTVSTVTHEPGDDWRMWFLGSAQGYVTSADGVHWDEATAVPTTDAPGTIVANPRYGQPGQPKYFGLKIGFADTPVVRQRTQNYYVYVSDDGITWTRPTPDIPAIYGRDTVMVSWDPQAQVFVATVKQWFMTTASPGTYWWEPRSNWVAFSTDFTHWTQPRLVFQSDVLDFQKVAADNPGKHTASDVYSLPTFRYGEQILSLPWMQDITDVSRIINMGQDVSTEHIELASSQNYYTWSRPAREPIVPKGQRGEWDWGFNMTSSNGFITDGDTVRLYYGSYAGEHACSQARLNAGTCEVLQVPSRIGMVTWQRDRFVALHSNDDVPGKVTTRTLQPTVAGGRLHLNVNGTVRVEVLDAGGTPIPGYTLADATPVAADTLDAIASWGNRTRLPSGTGPIRLRIQVQGDLYSYSIR